MSIIYANRNRDLKRVKASFDSIKNQTEAKFRVVFVDYGSEEPLVDNLKQLCNSYEFVTPYFLPVSLLLWNKSKALNYGILQTKTPYIFIADVDLVFHPETITLLNNLAVEDKFFLFSLGYLDRAESRKLTQSYNFEDLRPSRFGDVNGMILASKEAFLEVNGFDEFFHFYGSEDEDLFARMEKVGYKREANAAHYFNHNWHQSFAGSEDEIITGNPRVKNIMRINQRHFLRNMEKEIIKPIRQTEMGKVICKEESDLLQKPTKTVKIYNILSHVEHFLGEELPSYTGEIIKVEFVEDPYFHTLKHKLKKLLGKQTQKYCSLKEINDKVLKQIVYNYRDSNYSFKVADDLKSIDFRIQL
ncbi:glycosyltransferase family 2 protein [Gillisia mitskevichiae]|uniref:glycosyltransferase family 2 protein n=1 Tax=Gillisia mitskevichiae TaxID=270921 RepID=UPI001FEAA687|nr:glycosyltransferase [Gillisia mitskevichiae]